MGKAKSWLLLAHCFNMDGRAASQTITDRIPFFLERGIQPIVISAPTGTKDQRFPHYQILSAAPSGILFECRHILKNKPLPAWVRQVLSFALFVLLLPLYLLEKIFIHLDSHWSWAISATLLGRKLIVQTRPELIYSTAGPTSTHLAAYFLHQLTGLPWLAELHDPLCYGDQTTGGQRGRFHRWLEKTIAKHASTVFFFTEQAKKSAVSRNPELLSKAHVLRPGANPPQFSMAGQRDPKSINLGHFGSLTSDRNLGPIIEALAALVAAAPHWRSLIRIHIYGGSLDQVSASALSTYHLESIIEQHGRIEYDPATGKSGRQQILEAMRRCDALILLHGDDSHCAEYVPSKFYEYLLIDRPILGLTAPGTELEQLLIDTGHRPAYTADAKDVESTMRRLIEDWQATGLPDLQPKISFTVVDAVEQLIIAADRAIKAPR